MLLLLLLLQACIPKYYVKPLPSPLQLSPLYDLDSPAWGTEYEGGLTSGGGVWRMSLSPS